MNTEGGAASEWNPLAPTLAHTEGSPKDKMNFFKDCVLHKVVTPLIRAGAKAQSVLVKSINMIIDTLGVSRMLRGPSVRRAIGRQRIGRRNANDAIRYNCTANARRRRVYT